MVGKDSVSADALAVARRLDQLAARAERVQINVVVDPFTRAWSVEFSQVQRLSEYRTKGKVSSNG